MLQDCRKSARCPHTLKSQSMTNYTQKGEVHLEESHWDYRRVRDLSRMRQLRFSTKSSRRWKVVVKRNRRNKNVCKVWPNCSSYRKTNRKQQFASNASDRRKRQDCWRRKRRLRLKEGSKLNVFCSSRESNWLIKEEEMNNSRQGRLSNSRKKRHWSDRIGRSLGLSIRIKWKKSKR